MNITEALRLGVFGVADGFADLGYVYLMGCQGCLKVGKTVNPGRRRKGHQTGNPFSVRIVKTWWVSSMSQAERQLQVTLRDWNVRGEWYQPPPDVRKKLLSIRCLDTLLSTGRDKEVESSPSVPPIPLDFPGGIRYLAQLSPSGQTAHWVRRESAKVVTICGFGELTPANYWKMVNTKVRISINHKDCQQCVALVSHYPGWESINPIPDFSLTIV
jgi:hypothetical protein